MFQQPVTGGLSVNTDSREEVRGFYDAIYPASDNVPQDSTADASSCFPGHNSDAFQNADVLRINWFRAMAGMPANIYLDPLDDWGSQQMAVMMSANDALNHDPPPTYLCYNTNAAAYAGGDQCLGGDGAEAETLFIWDYGATNFEVGHRRWILYPEENVMGVGDVPGSGTLAANLTFVFDPQNSSVRPATRQPYVAWPPEGYVPYQVVFPYWSFALTNADFTNATVTMTSNGVPVSTVIQPYRVGYGENTLVWVPMGLDATTGGTSFPFDGTDTVYSVTVGNINYNGAIISYSYNVTVFDPAAAGSDYIPSVLKGPAQAVAGAGTVYDATPPVNPNVTSYNFMTAQLASGNLFDNASEGIVNFTLTPPPDYTVTTTDPNGSATCFNLEHAGTNSYYPQLFQLNEVLLPATNTVVSFEGELGYATTNEVARVQVSADGGANWTDLYARPGDDTPDSSLTNTTLSLSNYAGDTVLLRFNFDYQGGEYYDGGYPIGWFFTDILITNTLALVNQATNNSTVTNIVSGNLADSGYNGLTNFTLSPPPYYYVITNPPVGSEPLCFHLAHIDPTSQMLQLNETLVPSANSAISFSSQLGYATSDEYALVEVSTNNGANWTDLFSEAGSNGSGETNFTPCTLSLASCAGQPTLLCFNYSFTGGSFYVGSANYFGWNIEDILITNTQQQLVTTIDTTNFIFTPSQPGTYLLQDQPVIFNQFALSPGPVTLVTAVSPQTILMNPPVATNRQVQLNFTISGLSATTFSLLQAAKVTGPWTTNNGAPFTTNVPGTSYCFTVTNDSAAQFYRVQSP